MNWFLTFLFIFYIGCTAGWIMEFFFRRAVSGHWVNPGFLVGPYLPIYGFGLTALTLIYLLFRNMTVHPIIVILLMGATMTLIEFIGGLSFVDGKGVKLWDYSNEWGNYKGIICPLFSAIWTGIAAIYYFFLASPILNLLKWFSNNLAFSFVLGVFFGVIVIDYVYSTNLLKKIKKYAKENELDVKLEELRVYIQEQQKRRQEKYSFILSFKQNKPLKEFLDDYKKSKSTKKSFKLFRKN